MPSGCVWSLRLCLMYFAASRSRHVVQKNKQKYYLQVQKVQPLKNAALLCMFICIEFIYLFNLNAKTYSVRMAPDDTLIGDKNK